MERPGTTQHMLSWPSRRMRSMKNTMISMAGTPKKSEIRKRVAPLGDLGPVVQIRGAAGVTGAEFSREPQILQGTAEG